MRGKTMANLAEVVKELQQERSRLDEAIRVIGQLVSGNHTGARTTKRNLSAAARERIAAAQRARWAKARGAKEPPPARTTMSKASRNRIAAAQRARWAKARAQKKAA
jgi:predicted membrane metal-binding protein